MRHDRLASAALIGFALIGVAASTQLEASALLGLRASAVVVGFLGVVVGTAWHRPNRRRPWLLLAAGLAASATGQFLRLAQGGAADRLAVTVWLSLGSVLVLIAAVTATYQVRGRDPGSAVDASLLGVALWLLIWQWLVLPARDSLERGEPSIGFALQVAQFVVITAVLGLLVQTVRALPPKRRMALGLLTFGVLGALGGFLLDVLQQSAVFTFSLAGPRAALAVVANLAPGAAALHPTMCAVDDRVASAEDAFTVPRLVGFALALLAPPAALISAHVRGDEVVALGLALFWIVLATGILARTWLLLAARRAAEAEIAASERRMRSLVAHTGDLLLLVDPGNRPCIRYASPAAQRVLGHDADQLTGSCALELPVEPADADTYRAAVLGPDPLPRHVDVRMRHLDGRVRWIEVIVDHYDDLDGPALVLALDDITERKDAEIHWVEAAHRDALTGLLNRRGVEQWLEDALDPAGSCGGRVGLLLGDLDGFKQVNDTGGHPVGDEVLCHVAARLQRALRDGDVVGRLGGDEFAVLVPLGGDIINARNMLAGVAERLMATLRTPVVAGGRSWPVGMSVGIAAANGTDDSAAYLLRRADVALYQAKEAGKGRAVFDEQVVLR